MAIPIPSDSHAAPRASSAAEPFAAPAPGASLLLAFRPTSSTSIQDADVSPSPALSAPPSRSTVLLIGSNHLAAVRLFALLEASYKVVVSYAEHGRTSAAARVEEDTGAEATPHDGFASKAGHREGVNGVNGANGVGHHSLKNDHPASNASIVDPGLLHLIRSHPKQVAYAPLPTPSGGTIYATSDWRSYLQSLPQLDDILFVIFTDTLLLSSSHPSSINQSALALRHATHVLRLLLNVSDSPAISDFSFPVSHRFPLSSASSLTSPSSSPPSAQAASPLQLAITTNASSCRLATRLKREIVARCERSAGTAVLAVGRLRSELREQARIRARSSERAAMRDEDGDEDVEGLDLKGGLNRPVEQLAARGGRRTCSRARGQGRSQSRGREASTAKDTEVRMRWIAQISEYWPIDEIARLEWDENERKRLLRIFDEEILGRTAYATSLVQPQVAEEDPAQPGSTLSSSTSHHRLVLSGPPPPRPLQRGRILLIGSGPGSPHLLTLAAHRALTSSATLILSDKLVPPPILALIPKHIPLHIAKKFPGNADNAQNEFMDIAVAAAARGEVVVRLKQGDPYLYGRGGEEVVFFRERGFDPIVVPGVSSAFAGPLLGGMPVTMRGIADGVIVCTGVGKAGRVMTGSDWPRYHKKRTVAILMGVARLGEVVKGLTSPDAGYPPYLPIAIVEKASVHDGRVVRSSLEFIERVYERQGGKRVPGMIMVGWAVMALHAATEAEKEGRAVQLPPVFDSESESPGSEGVKGEQTEVATQATRERAVVEAWLGPTSCRVSEGGGTEGWDDVFGQVAPAVATHSEVGMPGNA